MFETAFKVCPGRILDGFLKHIWSMNTAKHTLLSSSFDGLLPIQVAISRKIALQKDNALR